MTPKKQTVINISGQHLLSAILEKEHNLPTTSWWLGVDESYIELDAKEITDDVIQATEDKCNELIRKAVPVDVKFYKACDSALDQVTYPKQAVISTNFQ